MKLRVSVRPRKPHIFRETSGCRGLVLGQAPPGPRESLPRGWRPLAGPAEQRLAKLANLVPRLEERRDLGFLSNPPNISCNISCVFV